MESYTTVKEGLRKKYQESKNHYEKGKKKYQESKLHLSPKNSQKPRPRSSRIKNKRVSKKKKDISRKQITFVTQNLQKPSPRSPRIKNKRVSRKKKTYQDSKSLGASKSSGRHGYWRGNVHNMNYPNMRSAHPHRQKRETAKTIKRMERRSGDSFSIINATELLAELHQWQPKMALVPKERKNGTRGFVREKKRPVIRVMTCFGCGKPGHKHADCPHRDVEEPKSETKSAWLNK